MNSSTEKDHIAIIKDLAEATSTQAQVANRTWLTTIAIAFLVLLPNPPSSSATTSTTALPLGVIVPTSLFYPVAFAMLAILVVALAAAHAQQIRADRLGFLLVNDLVAESPGSRIHLRDLFDMRRLPSLTRVAPLAQLIRGKHQFAKTEGECPLSLRLASTLFYVALKVIVLGVLFILPGLALLVAYRRTLATGLSGGWQALLIIAGVLAGLSLLVVAIADVQNVWDRVRRLASRPEAVPQSSAEQPG